MYGFPKVQMLRGELKRSEIRGGVRFQLTTREFVQQRGTQTFRIALEHILGVVECTDSDLRSRAFSNHVPIDSYGRPYKITATTVHLISTSGVSEQHQVSFYTRLSTAFAKQLECILQTVSPGL